MAGADRQTAPNFVSLKAVSDALVNRAGESAGGVKRFVVRGMAEGSLRYHHRGSAEPPPSFFRGHPDSFIFDGSDMTNPVCEGGYAYTLPGVSLAWEDVIAAYPELGAEPPELGRSRVEVSFAAPLMKWLGSLMTWLGALRKPAPSAEEEPGAPATAPAPKKKRLRRRDEALDWLLEKKEQNPPKYWKKMEWCRERLKEGSAEFVEGEFPWGSAESILSKLNDLIAGRLVRDPTTGRVVPSSKLKK